MPHQLSRHLSEELLEEYAMGRLPEHRAAAVEEHLLLCNHCQNELVALDEFRYALAAAMPAVLARQNGQLPHYYAAKQPAGRQAAGLLPEAGSANQPNPKSGSNPWSGNNPWSAPNPDSWGNRLWHQAKQALSFRPSPAWAMAGACVALAVMLVPFQSTHPTAQTVALEANRSSADFSEVSANAPLNLQLQAAGIPATIPIAVEIISSAGTDPVRYAARRQGDAVQVDQPIRLRTGKYWVRLRDATSNELLREFGLQVK